MSEPLEAFAESCGIHLTAELITAAPRDVLLPLEQTEQHYLVALARPGAEDDVRMVFAKPAVDGSPPTVAEVLWWLASDAFALEQAEGAVTPWAHTHGFPPQAAATVRMFEHQRQQSRALRQLLGDVGFRRLLGIYEAEMVGSN